MSYQNYKCERDYVYDDYKYNKCNKCYNDYEEMTHVHEYSESVKLAEECEDRHNHRAAGVTGEAIPINGGTNHVHKINDNVDFLDHFHKICVTTGPAIRIPGTDKHIHLICGETTVNDGDRKSVV